MDRNKIKPNEIALNIEFLNSLQPEWSKYVTLTCQSHKLRYDHFDKLYDYLSEFANSYTRPSYSHAIPSYSCSQQPYYVTYPTSLHDCDDHNKGEIQGDAQEDKLFTITMLLARSITQHFSTPRNNRLRTSSNTKNQVFIQDGHVDIQRRKREFKRETQDLDTKTSKCWILETRYGVTTPQELRFHYARVSPKPRVRDSKYFREHMMLVAKDEARVNLDKEENDFMLMSSYGDDQIEELNASVIIDNESDVEPTYDAEVISEVNASWINQINGLLLRGDHEQQNHEKLETIKHTSVDDQIASDIIFDDPYVEDNSGQVEHEQDAQSKLCCS
ncbi:hypothetical protein Tco_0972750 [Tanacetum coccineum]